MIPEEDRGPTWLRDYGFTDFGDIAADIEAMEHFAQKLSADVQDNYVPHMQTASDSMNVKIPDAASTFPELAEFMRAHETARDVTHANVWGYANGTNHFATAADTISKEYRGTDARSHAKVKDVDRAFEKAITPSPGGDDQGSDL